MGTKFHHTFCDKCGIATRHITTYSKQDCGQLVATVRCSEHSERIE
ncbi:hypothetical protein [Arthrobacter sp. CJ23]|nr:hypothetical protein [Arthrobacter sp. CJ23]UVJ38732.1 hypothetical protein NVV90_16135 [Arthrobacter sp. CJ23]